LHSLSSVIGPAAAALLVDEPGFLSLLQAVANPPRSSTDDPIASGPRSRLSTCTPLVVGVAWLFLNAA
jgi:hypothetical protein